MSLEVEELAILPVQMVERPPVPQDGELALLWAVLFDAVSVYVHGCESISYEGQDFRDAERWLFSSDRSWVTSFENICDALEINGRDLRLRLLDLRWHGRGELAQAS